MDAQTQDMTDLASRTMFLAIEFNRFGNSRKADVEMTVEVPDRFSHSKRLLNSPELKEVNKQDNALRVWLDKGNRCWRLSKGMRCVPYDAVDEVWERCNTYMNTTRPALVTKCGEAYLAQVAEAQKELGKDFNPKDYPALAVFLAEFDMAFSLMSFTTPEKLKIVSPKVYAVEKAKEAENLKLATEEIRTSMRVLFTEYVDQLMDVISPTVDGKKKRLHKSKVEKLQAFLNTFDMRNVTDDAMLQSEVDKLKLIMKGVDVQNIKDSDGLKAELAAKFAEVSGTMNSLTEVKGRKIRAA